MAGSFDFAKFPAFADQVNSTQNVVLAGADANRLLKIDSSLAPRTVTVPRPDAMSAGGVFLIISPFGATNPVNVAFAGGSTFNGGQSGPIVLRGNNSALLLVSGGGSDWGTYGTSGEVPNSVRSETTSTTQIETDFLIEVDASSGPLAVTLLSAAAHIGLVVHVTKTDSSGNPVSVGGPINGQATIDLSAQYSAMALISVGSEWRII